MVIQTRESDLVLATFGRSFYVLDDYSPLREVSEAQLNEKAHMYAIKDALMYIQKRGRYGQGSTRYTAKNPAFGATFTYYLKDVPKTDKQIREKKEKELFKNGQKIPQPSWRELEEQDKELKPYLIFTITDMEGNVVKKLTKSASKGLHRITWNLRYSSPMEVNLKNNEFNPVAKDRRFAMMVMPGKYKVSMGMVFKGQYTELTPAMEFTTKPLNNTTLPAPDRKELVAFQQKVSKLTRVLNGSVALYEDLTKKVAYLKQTALSTPNASMDLMKKIEVIEKQLNDIHYTLEGPKTKASWEEVPPQQMPLNQRMDNLISPHWQSTSAVTQVEKDAYKILVEEFKPVYDQIKNIMEKSIPEIENELEKINAPYTPGRLPEWKF